MNYILDEDKQPVWEPDTLKWARWFEDFKNRRVAYDEVNDFEVSTVFLGIDHGLASQGPPVLFETMVFDSDGKDVIMERTCTWDEALKQHAKVVAALRGKGGR